MTVSTRTQLSTEKTVGHLAGLIKQQPAYEAFMQAYDSFQSDEKAQRLLEKGKRLRGQLQFDWSEEKRAHFNQVLDEFEALPSVKAYNQAELALRELICAVDAVISETIGVEFAANAKRRSCCGG